MTWYSLFLLSIPEALVLILFPIVLFGLSIRDKIKSLLLFALIHGSFAFTVSVFLDQSLKPFLTIGSFLLLTMIIFRVKLLHALIITLTAYITLTFCEVFISLIFIEIFPYTFDEILSTPWIRIIYSYFTAQIPILLTILVLIKFKVNIRLPRHTY